MPLGHFCGSGTSFPFRSRLPVDQQSSMLMSTRHRVSCCCCTPASYVGHPMGVALAGTGQSSKIILTLIAEVLQTQRDELVGRVEGVLGRGSITLSHVLQAYEVSEPQSQAENAPLTQLLQPMCGFRPTPLSSALATCQYWIRLSASGRVLDVYFMAGQSKITG